MIKKFRNFLNDSQANPIIAILVAGAYALLYYYDKNYALINSRSQFTYLVALYIIGPLLLFYFLDFLFKQNIKTNLWRHYLLPIFNLSCFFLTIVVSLYGFDVPKLLAAMLLGIISGYVLRVHLKKVMVIQCILILLVLPKLIPDFYREITYTKQWMEQPDDIELAKFKKRPNIYVIQPDGYTSFSTFRDSIHNYDNSEFETYLKSKSFTIYDEYRSNYSSTLGSNSALFAMKHHYYGNTTLGINPRHNKRNEIVESNPVLRTLKHNNYKTFLMLQVPYLLSNRPNIDFDYCNISLDDISYLNRGFSGKTDLTEDTKLAIKNNKTTSNFFFIESMLPSHITTNYNPESSVQNERKLYIERIEKANLWLKELIDFITKEDPNGLIVIAADHGGFVGFNFYREKLTKTDSPLLINSIFSSLLAIKWPNGSNPTYHEELKSSVNLFRILFTHLSENDDYLLHLQENKSYITIRKGAATGIYEYIDDKGHIVFKKFK
ncbi:hypothetical protein [Winogradskyella luteola]|uniref:Sulfatase N-terminal domain-containing protein n=1 Tax=Winogradskyella luteola TaxID=2828330 RepID=A0A9X1FAF8_9FLAO|nr:hypothetical protein [Winogradskyella luteola]MBV7270439.1 hypothetical protein [Winogradskyella luteola]